jgi:polysaccharide biosynthesis transport protein
MPGQPTILESEARPRAGDRSLNLREFVKFLWRRWPIITAITTLSILAGWVYALRSTPLYSATAQVLLEHQQTKPFGVDVLRIDDTEIADQIAIIKSDSLLKRVVLNEGLVPPVVEKAATPASQWSLRGLRAYAYGEAGDSEGKQAEQPEHEDQAEAIQGAINRLQGAIFVNRIGQSHLLNISVTLPDPAAATRIANSISDAFVLDKLDARHQAAKQASTWLGDQLAELGRQLHDSEEAVAQFRTQTGLVRTGATGTATEQQLADLNSKVVAARADAAERRTRVEFLANVVAGEKTAAIPESFLSPLQHGIMASLRQKLADLEQQEAQLLGQYDNRHLAVLRLQAAKRAVEEAIRVETERAISTAKSDYAVAVAREAAAAEALNEATGQGGLDSQAAIRLRELERTAAVNKTLFEDFLHKAKTSEQATTQPLQVVRILVPAQLPLAPSSPNVHRFLIVALVVGLGLGIGSAKGIELLQVGFMSPQEVEDRLRVPVLAVVAQMGDVSRFGESIRTLRSGILISDAERPPKVIQVTSAKPDEGKTTVALAMAISVPRGMRTLIIDGDLRRSSVSDFFDLTSKKGLVDVLTEAIGLQEAVYVDRHTGVHVMPGGSRTPNAPDVLSSEKIGRLIPTLKSAYDIVIIDSPPLGPVVDAVVIARSVDATVLVVKWASTPRELVETALKRLPARTQVCGVVLNYVNERRARKYGSFHYGSPHHQAYFQA